MSTEEKAEEPAVAEETEAEEGEISSSPVVPVEEVETKPPTAEDGQEVPAPAPNDEVDDEATEDEDDDEEEEGEVQENAMEVDELPANGAGAVSSAPEEDAPPAEVSTAPVAEVESEPEAKAEAEPEVVETEEEKPVEAASYSTRGRTETTALTALDVLADAGHQREAEVELPREKEQPPAIKPSFLSDSLTEEERRTRTRYLPDVDGFNKLRKQEVNSDLALARCLTTSAGVASTVAKKVRRAREDDMEVDETVAPSDEDKAADILRRGSRTIELGNGLDYELPSTAFVAPSASSTNGDSNTRGKPTPPNEVEAVAAFNPPRPPESVGPKKKHRMLRWERRPADIEVDLSTYRKTVQKTRDELKKAQLERDRIEMLDNHLRRNFLNHLECMDEELIQISEETAKVQQDCVSAADLLTSRTRSRGAGKSSYVMRDVLAVLRARGAEMQEKGISYESLAKPSSETSGGVGGVGGFSFQPWDNTKQIPKRKVCTGWIVPGDKVKCPLGEGTVVKVLPPSKAEPLAVEKGADKNEPTIEKMDVDSPLKKTPSPKEESTEQKSEDVSEGLDLGKLRGPRIEIKLSSGSVFFPPEAVEPLEDPACFSDSRLASRWKGIMETAPLFGETVDVEAMAEHLQEKSEDEDPSPISEGDTSTAKNSGETEETVEVRETRDLPFGSNLIPTSAGRGALVSGANLVELDETLDNTFFRSTSLLGEPSNPGVPGAIRESEKKAQERIHLKARLRQLRNEVNRQRRIRVLNQRTHAATEERAVRIESLVSEMRTDLKSLKRRLEEEVRALGIDDAEADLILRGYNNRHQSGEGHDSPFKRPRQEAGMDLESEEEEVFDGQDGSGTDNAALTAV
eukprot:CAMPEP_0172454700 /NCGR_PEP_ID=MMETSP1065-20121228/11616_1 /TAXON_ID=265537 /ORGANISM="Amphiprora paludosa, Strain CCMP125" /LENGTH=858 /DNA_ID=CAMNT_0013207079 /DNA_START=120 /DNA_END=2696 /DNA_ORIENTATION=+